MKIILKRTAVMLMAFAMVLTMMPVLGALTDGAAGSQTAYAETVYKDVQPSPPDGFVYTIYAGESGASIWISGYVGNDTQVILPTSVTYKGVTYNAWDSKNNTYGNGAFTLGKAAFNGNTKIKKVAIPYGYESIDNQAFNGCTSLTEVAIADTVGYISTDIFNGCDSLKTYYYSGDQLKQDFGEDQAITMLINSGLAQDSNGNPVGGVTVYTKAGSVVEKAVKQIDPSGGKIKVVTVADPYSKNTVKPESGGSASKSIKGEDGTAYGKGASESVVNAAILKYAKESDPKGAVFGLLQARLGKVTKNSLTLQWTKVKGAKKYAVYGNACGSKNKMKTLVKKTTKTKMVFKKVAGKKVAKGKYYKFMVVAFDKNNKVLSSSVIVHAATTGGKVGNDKAVKTKAKKDKVTIKKGKKFKLGAKAVPQSKKLKVQRHRGVKFESGNKAVATVSAKGVITGKKKGTCYVYAYAQNGVFRKIKVTVK